MMAVTITSMARTPPAADIGKAAALSRPTRLLAGRPLSSAGVGPLGIGKRATRKRSSAPLTRASFDKGSVEEAARKAEAEAREALKSGDSLPDSDSVEDAAKQAAADVKDTMKRNNPLPGGVESAAKQAAAEVKEVAKGGNSRGAAIYGGLAGLYGVLVRCPAPAANMHALARHDMSAISKWIRLIYQCQFGNQLNRPFSIWTTLNSHPIVRMCASERQREPTPMRYLAWEDAFVALYC